MTIENFVIGERYRITNNALTEKILFYVGQSVKDPGLHYFEYSLGRFHLNKTFETALIPVKKYNFINVTKEEEEKKNKEKIRKLEDDIKNSEEQLKVLKKT